MDEYLNPLNMYQNQNAAPNNPFWSGYQGGKFQQQAQPFIDMMKRGQELGLQKKEIETGEFASPEAAQVRSQQRRATGAEAQTTIDTAPVKSEAEIKRLREEIRALPSMTDQKIAQARQATMTAEGMPHRELLSEIGQSYDTLKDTPEQERPQVWGQLVRRWQMSHPGAKLPDSFMQYSPEHMADAAAIRYNSLNSPEQIGKERLKGMETDSGIVREGMQQEGANYRANVSANAHIQGAQLHLQAGETPPKAEARLRRELRANPGDEASRRELTGYLEERYDKAYEKTGRAQILQMQGLSNPAIQQQYQVEQESYKARKFLNDSDLYNDIDSSGRDWVIRAIEAKDPKTGQYVNANYGFENIIALGKKLGKIKSKK